MRVIHKKALNVLGTHTLEFDVLAKVKLLHVGMQGITPCIWFELDAAQANRMSRFDHHAIPQQYKYERIQILTVFTGQDFGIPEDMVYFGSCVSDEFVVHVYVEKKYVSHNNN